MPKLQEHPLAVILLLAAGFLAAVFVYPLFFMLGGEGSQVFAGTAAQFVTWTGLAWWRLRANGVRFRTLFLGSQRVGEAIGFGFLGGLGALAAQYVIGHIASLIYGVLDRFWSFDWQEQAQSEQLRQLQGVGPDTPLAVWIALFLAIVVLAPLWEELFFRGYVYNAFRSRWGVPFGMVTSATLFALLHGVLILFPTILLTGIVFTYIYHKSGSLLASIVSHAVLNCIVFTILVANHLAPLAT